MPPTLLTLAVGRAPDNKERTRYQQVSFSINLPLFVEAIFTSFINQITSPVTKLELE
jgi:hypothetical protein